tara:strand:- start:43 stop:1242 length:1200 start_codon:yes stop_codon:yes gene_type:complete
MALKNNTWTLNQWYEQDVAGNVDYTGANQLWKWGDNTTGQLGQNNRTALSSPTQIPGTTWSKIGDGALITYAINAIKTDGTLWAWGYQNHGQLGQNQETTQYSSPVQIPGSWSNSTTGYYMTAGVKTDGTLWSWGYNLYGTLGQNTQGNNSNRSSPIQIGSDTDWNDVHGTGAECFATKTDGTLWCWGNLSNGSHGNGSSFSPTQRSSPVQIPGTGWGAVSGGGNYQVLANKTDGTLWGWGNNNHGQLGLNSTSPAVYDPTQIGSGTDWATGRGKFVVNYNNGSAAIKTDGTLWMWGRNNNGQLGLSQATSVKISSPTQLPGNTWATVSSENTYFIATKTDGTLWTWGDNQYGILGQNQALAQLASVSSPIQIPGTDWTTDGYGIVAGWGDHAAVFKQF